MNTTELLQKVSKILNSMNLQFALAGGLVASLYRDEARTTEGLDFLLYSEVDSEEVAKEIILKVGLTPAIARKADLEGGPKWAIKRKNTAAMIVVGRDQKSKTSIGLDFILPAIPWFEQALKRAQLHKVDFGFGPIPCMTKEDILISKAFAVQSNSSRFKDLDDIQSILNAGHHLDIAYLKDRVTVLKINKPDFFLKKLKIAFVSPGFTKSH